MPGLLAFVIPATIAGVVKSFSDSPNVCPGQIGELPLLVYNRIPKCGSTMMIRLLRRTARHGKFLVTSSSTIEYENQPPQVFNRSALPSSTDTSHWGQLLDVIQSLEGGNPHVYIQHTYWPNITSDHKSPSFFQLMREPIAREVSSFYYKMYGPRPELSMVKAKSKFMRETKLPHPPSINEHIAWMAKAPGTAPGGPGRNCRNDIHGNMQTRFFCGFHPDCIDICSAAAIKRAKEVLEHEYMFVGLLEDLEVTLVTLEQMLPSMLTGIWDAYHEVVSGKLSNKKNRVGRASKMEQPTPENRQVLEQHHKQDVELYRFAKELFRVRTSLCNTTRKSTSMRTFDETTNLLPVRISN